MKMNLAQAVDAYLKTRRSFGFGMVKASVELGSFVRFIKQIGHSGPLTVSLAMQWASQPQNCQPSYHALRLSIIRGFAQFQLAYDPQTEIPSAGYYASLCRRRTVHIYSREEIGLLLDAASVLGRVHRLRASTFCTLVGLLDCSGLRIGEALGLCDQDIDFSEGVLTIRRAKNGRTRRIPVQPSTVEALQRYRSLRQKALGSAVAPAFFVTFRGKSLGYHGVHGAFCKLRQDLGWTQAPVPRLHDLRHTFTVRTLLGWYQSGEPVGPKLWLLSTYLGHRHVADTYWYLSAVPQLMQLCQERFATTQNWASGGLDHA